MIAALLIGLSSVFVACSDDDPTTMGPVPVNSVRVTGTTATVIWSIVPNDKCGGYEVSLLQGSKDGAVVATQKLDNRTCQATFEGLTPVLSMSLRPSVSPARDSLTQRSTTVSSPPPLSLTQKLRNLRHIPLPNMTQPVQKLSRTTTR